MDGQRHRLSVHHVGGRGGSRGFPVMPRFERDVINVLYDADSECLAQVEEHNQGLGSRTVVLPHCLGAAQGPAEFHLNYDPYTSSVLPLNQEYAGFYYASGDHDYVIGEALRSMERLPVELTTLDTLARDESLAPPPDFLSIDTQGSEYAILEGATQVLREHTLALLLEVEFHPLYTGQKLFGDLCRLMDERGFHFVKVHIHQDYSPARYAVGLRGEGFQVSGDALFLRKLDTLTDRAADSARRERQLRKLAFFSIAFCQIEYALEALAQLNERIPLDRSVWEAFLAEFAAAAETRKDEPLPPSFAEKFSFEASRARFVPSSNEEAPATPISPFRRFKQAVRQVPGLHAAEQLVREAGRAVRRKTRPPADSPVERVLRAYSLAEHADVLRERRLAELRHLRGSHSIRAHAA